MTNLIDIAIVDEQLQRFNHVLDQNNESTGLSWLHNSLSWSFAGRLRSALLTTHEVSKQIGDAQERKEAASEEQSGQIERFVESMESRLKQAESRVLDYTKLFEWSYSQAPMLARPGLVGRQMADGRVTHGLMDSFNEVQEPATDRVALYCKLKGVSEEEARKVLRAPEEEKLASLQPIREEFERRVKDVITRSNAAITEALENGQAFCPDPVPLDDLKIDQELAVNILSRAADKAASDAAKAEVWALSSYRVEDMTRHLTNERMLKVMSTEFRLQAHVWNQELEAAPSVDENAALTEEIADNAAELKQQHGTGARPATL